MQNKSKIKILHIISDTNIGGAGKLLLNIATCIDKERFDLIFAVPRNSKLKEKLNKEGRVYCYSGKGDKSCEVKSITSLCRIIKNTKPHIVHTHSSLSGRIAAIFVGIKKSKIIYTKHCVFDIPMIYRYNICRKIYNNVDNLFAGHIIAVAESAKKELMSRGIDPNKITVIINGSLPLKRYSKEENKEMKSRLGLSESDFVVGLVPRLEDYKGHKTLIKAAKLSKDANECIKFIFMGDGSCREELMDFCKKLDVDDRIIFTGFVDNVAQYMSIFDLNINCSTGTETSCLAISEGLSLGIPAIVSDFGGNPNMVINGITGYVFPQNNHFELYKIIKNLKNSPKITEKMGNNAKIDYQKRFSAAQMAEKYENFYINLIKG